MTTSDTKQVPEPRNPSTAAETAAAPGGGAFLCQPAIQPVFTRELFSPEQREIEQMVRKFARDEIAPRVDDIEKLDRDLSMTLMRGCGELGLTAIDIPEAYGGLELDKTTSALVVEALTTGGSASWVVTFSAHVGIGTLPLVFYGTEDQKQRYLGKLGTVEWLGAYALSEPEAGSDVTRLATKAKLSDDGASFVLTGNKQWITNGGWASLYVVFADLEGAGVTAFLVERDTPGLSTGDEEKKLGIKGSSTVSLILDGVTIPKENLLGEPGGGLPIALNILNVGRFKLGAADLGGCKITLEQVVTYALDRRQFGQPIAYFEAVRKKFADMLVRTYVLDSVIYRTVGLMDQRISQLDPEDPEITRRTTEALEEYAIESSIAKILGSETMSRVADHGVQILAGNGFSEEYPLARLYRDCRIDRIFEGTNEINRMVIYGYYLKKALTEELPIRDAVRQWDQAPTADEDGLLAWESAALETARGVVLKCLFEAISIHGQDLRNAQVVGEDLADLLIGLFGATAAVNRILQLPDAARADRATLAMGRLATAAFLEEVVRRVFRLRPVLFGDPYGRRATEALDAALARLQLPFDPVAEIQILTDDLFDHGSYRFRPTEGTDRTPDKETRMSRQSVIIDAVRSPMGVKKGRLVGIRADDLAAQVIQALLERQTQPLADEVEDVVLGCAFPEHTQGMLMARGVALLAGLPKESGGKVVNRFCGSSMDAVHQLSQAIVAGDLDCGIAVGVEDMFAIPMGGFNPSFHPRLEAMDYYIGMGETAEKLAAELEIGRERQEEFGIRSHRLALEAWKEGRFEQEVVAVKRGDETIDRDEGPREPDVEKIRSLEPAFIADGTVTAATSSPISIGAAAVLVTSDAFAERHGLEPRARIVSRAIAGVDWTRMGMGPIPASATALERAGLEASEIDFIELNEAFAAQALYVLDKTGWPLDQVNVNGGAIALGHPLGASGARILTTLLNVLEQRDAKRGLATMCIGTGQGIATIIERG